MKGCDDATLDLVTDLFDCVVVVCRCGVGWVGIAGVVCVGMMRLPRQLVWKAWQCLVLWRISFRQFHQHTIPLLSGPHMDAHQL